jgi:hypothetical protein
LALGWAIGIHEKTVVSDSLFATVDRYVRKRQSCRFPMPWQREKVWAIIAIASKLQHTTHPEQVNALLQNIIDIDNAYRKDKSYQWTPVIQSAMEAALVKQSPHLAIRLVEAMLPSAHRDRHRILLFQNLLSFGEEYIPEAETVMAKIPKSAFKVRSQIALADAYFTWGKLEQSSATLQQAQADLQKVQDSEIVKARRNGSDGFRAEENTNPWLSKKESRSS